MRALICALSCAVIVDWVAVSVDGAALMADCAAETVVENESTRTDISTAAALMVLVMMLERCVAVA